MRNLRQAFKMGTFTFIIAILVTIFSTGMIQYVPLPFAMIILLLIIAIGIIFDVIGVAVTVADEAPINAKASKKIFGAKKALFLIKRADEVANLCCDIVGDICGTISGALGTLIVLRISINADWNQKMIEILVLALIAAITVGGKAYGKRLGISKANDIIFNIGRFLSSTNLLVNFRKKTKLEVKKDGIPRKDRRS